MRERALFHWEADLRNNRLDETVESCILGNCGEVCGRGRITVNVFGAVAQLGERYVRNVQVSGSIPLCSILIRKTADL